MVATASVSHGSKPAVATMPLPGGFVLVSPRGSGSSATPDGQILFRSALVSLSLVVAFGVRSPSGARFSMMLRLGSSLRLTRIDSCFSREVIPLLTTDTVAVAQLWRTRCVNDACSSFGVQFSMFSRTTSVFSEGSIPFESKSRFNVSSLSC